MKVIRIILGLVAILAGFASNPGLSQTPSIQRVQGELQAGEVIELQGSGFGSVGPNIAIYDDFETSEPLVGAWSGGKRVPVNGGHGGGRAHLAFDRAEGTGNLMRAVFDKKYDEVLLSYRVRVPRGTKFPGRTSGAGEFSTNSSWKLTWLFDSAKGYLGDGNFDLSLPTYVGSNFLLAGNDFNYKYLSTDWWSWASWNELTVYLSGERNVENFFRTVSKEKGADTVNLKKSPFPSKVSDHFDRLNVPGWIRGGSDTEPLYDDVYVALGEGSRARVEIASTPSLSDATRISILPVESWNDTSIRARLPRAFPSGEAYVFVTTADGIANKMGISVDSDSTCDSCPRPPSNLEVN